MPIVVTAPGARSFEVTVDDVRGDCAGDTWSHAGGVSQQCWITLPRTAGRHTLTAHATLSDDSRAGATSSITASGPRTSTVDRATRDRILTCGNTGTDVWLTFDDGFLSTRTMNRVLATLTAENVRARFFATGTWARSNPGMVRALQRAGHLVENHTDTHESLNAIDDDALEGQAARGPATRATLLRPGFGAGTFTTRVVQAAKRHGQELCYWTTDTRDYSGASADALIARVLHGDGFTPPARPGGVVLMHMTGRHTPEALPGIIRGLRAKGLTLPPLR
ncbi:polysaccharide deacetylase family protein [Mobilicoccus caccae]|uniref:NodB homology domain-containing protein n=1 Tax=Mobilicoccus caccae TaxID=1859295 RepID=A0ABQ6IMG1_9MICO|nr:polysaccharide deacetylase family protein [Mobilicoccus caccae]GMA38599.1 hypothetical protein GCM10025883_06440 [Mobilicoccus caccae]